jgi:hypothetical protein
VGPAVATDFVCAQLVEHAVGQRGRARPAAGERQDQQQVVPVPGRCCVVEAVTAPTGCLLQRLVERGGCRAAAEQHGNQE